MIPALQIAAVSPVGFPPSTNIGKTSARTGWEMRNSSPETVPRPATNMPTVNPRSTRIAVMMKGGWEGTASIAKNRANWRAAA